ncbi:MerR family transcriptional regulator [Oceanobacter mangrovi]|uniref:MerR family transcriptional regulator n=1 Tax=Oceanobacter mangrovi TaxID=2862510 RepID=UPI001C8E360E|nr:MerR family transcriptional regulator [Oceanobacter mangrovi]
MKIRQLAERTGLPSQTIRYYEDIGLLPAAKRGENGYRSYAEHDVERLIFIRRCKALHIPLADMKRLVALKSDQAAPCGEVDRIIRNQLVEVQHRLDELRQLEHTLQALANSCHNDTISSCEILQRLGTVETACASDDPCSEAGNQQCRSEFIRDND